MKKGTYSARSVRIVLPIGPSAEQQTCADCTLQPLESTPEYPRVGSVRKTNAAGTLRQRRGVNTFGCMWHEASRPQPHSLRRADKHPNALHDMRARAHAQQCVARTDACVCTAAAGPPAARTKHHAIERAANSTRDKHIRCNRTGLTPAAPAPGLGLTPATSALKLGSSRPHLHRDRRNKHTARTSHRAAAASGPVDAARVGSQCL